MYYSLPGNVHGVPTLECYTNDIPKAGKGATKHCEARVGKYVMGEKGDSVTYSTG